METQNTAELRPENMSAREREGIAAVRAIADKTGIPMSEIMGDARRRDVIWPRLACYVVLRDELGWTLMQITEFMGRKSHKTVMSGLETVRSWKETDRHFQKWWDRYVAPAVELGVD